MKPLLRRFHYQPILLIASVATGGCTSQSTLEIDRLNLLPSDDVTVEFELGDFCIPIPEEPPPGAATPRRRNYMELAFELSAEIVPDDEPRLTEVLALREGAFRDCVIRVCRNVTAEDLCEPDLVTLKMRLQEAIEPILGLKLIRKLVFVSLKQYEL